MARRARVANTGLKAVAFSARCRWLVRVPGKAVTGARFCRRTRTGDEEGWRGRGYTPGVTESVWKCVRRLGLWAMVRDQFGGLCVVTSCKTLCLEGGTPSPGFL